MKTYTEKEVIEMLIAYRLSDSGTFNIAETKVKWKNTFDSCKNGVEAWLEIANLSIEERAKIWFEKLNIDFVELLKRKYKTSDITEIYKKCMLK